MMGWVISMLLPTLLGYQFLLALERIWNIRWGLLVSLAIAFGTGFGFLAQLMLLLDVAHLRLNFFNICVAIIATAGMIFLISKIFVKSPMEGVDYLQFPQKTGSDNDNLSRLKIFLSRYLILTPLAFYLFYIFWYVFNIPIIEWDSIVTSVSNAKVIYYDQSLEKIIYFDSPSFPLQIPLSLVWIANTAGDWNDSFLKTIFPLNFLSFLIIYHAVLNQLTKNKWWAWLGVLMILSSNLVVHHAQISYRDITLMLYYVSALMFMLLWFHTRNNALLFISSLWIGFAAFTKIEGTAYFVVAVFLFFFLLMHRRDGSIKQKLSHFLLFILPAVIITLFYYFYKLGRGVPLQQHMQPHFRNLLSGGGEIFLKFTENLFLTANWNILWLFLMICLAFYYKKFRSDITINFFLLSIVLSLAMLYFSALISDSRNGFISRFTISRILIPFFPMCPLLIILICSRAFKES